MIEQSQFAAAAAGRLAGLNGYRNAIATAEANTKWKKFFSAYMTSYREGIKELKIKQMADDRAAKVESSSFKAPKDALRRRNGVLVLDPPSHPGRPSRKSAMSDNDFRDTLTEKFGRDFAASGRSHAEAIKESQKYGWAAGLFMRGWNQFFQAPVERAYFGGEF